MTISDIVEAPSPDPDPVPSPQNGVCKASDGNWYYYIDGVIQTNYNGFASNSNGKWWVENGKVTFGKNGILKDSTGAIGTKGTWYYVVGSQVQTAYTGVANYRNANGWWYIKGGKVDFSANTVAKNSNGWWYVKGGKVDFSFTGIAPNTNGTWYMTGGKVQFGFTGSVTYRGETYTVRNGKAI